MEEIRKEFSYNNQAPTVELLEEIVIRGKVSSSTIKRCGKTNNEVEESINATLHVESDTILATLAQSDDTASTNCPSYGSFTAEKKKIMMKQVTNTHRQTDFMNLYLFIFLFFGCN